MDGISFPVSRPPFTVHRIYGIIKSIDTWYLARLDGIFAR